MEKFLLRDGNEIPAVGFGVFMIPADGSTYTAVRNALEVGYRHIDTAAAYFNEAEVGKAVKDSGIAREEIFITSKLWLQDHGYAAARKALEDAKSEGMIHSIGVSNMTPEIWNRFVPSFETVPAVNQVECNPYFQQRRLRKILDESDVKLEAWGPLGQGNKKLLSDPLITELAEKYNKSAGQIILRFEVQEGMIVLPKSTNPERIRSNLAIFDFALAEEEMDKLRALDTGKGTHDPNAEGVGEMLLANYKVHD